MFIVCGGLFFNVVRLVDLIDMFVIEEKEIEVDFLELLDIILIKFFGVFCGYFERKFDIFDKRKDLDFKEIYYLY